MLLRKNMLHTPAAKALLLAGAATLLQGCVAAIPLAAGSLMAGSNIRGDDRQAVAQAPAPIESENPANGVVRVEAGEPEPRPAAEPAPSMAADIAPVEAGLATERASDLENPVEVSAQSPAKSAMAASEPKQAMTPSSPVAVQSAPVASPEPVSVAGDAGFADAYRAPGTTQGAASMSSAEAAARAARLARSVETPPAAPAPSNVALQAPRPQPVAKPVTQPIPQPSAEPARPAQVAAAAAPVEPPVSATPRTMVEPAVTPAPNAITQLLSYANQRKFTSGESRESAMLADRISLEPDRAQCGGVKPAVLIDLDPAGGVFEPARASNPPAGLGAGLSQLRTQGVHVAWISSNPEERSNLIRRALTRTGLDIYGRDTVLLIRKDDERKQTLREEFAKTYCLIAIAGDARADFDELYDYLLNPNEAASLEPLFGEGWFIIPQPLVPQGS